MTNEELDAVKKEIAECHTADGALRSFITDVQGDLSSFRSRMGEVSQSTYQTDRKEVSSRLDEFVNKLGANEMAIYQRIDEVERKEIYDRKLI